MERKDLLLTFGMWLAGCAIMGVIALALGVMFRFITYMFSLGYGS
jgi:vacuolar-type H+-ATPase subunit I/STV1